MTDQRVTRRSPVPAAVTSVAVVAVVAVMAALSVGETVPWAVTGILGGVLVAALVAWTAAREIGKPESAPAPHRMHPAATGAQAAETPAERARALWADATDRHDRVLTEYSEWELDPRMLLSYPALWNYALPETQEFFTAMERCSRLRTGDIPGGPKNPHPGAVEDYDAATRRLLAAWRVAEQNARRTGHDRLSAPLAKDADRALKLLSHADGAATEAEEASYLSQASTLLHRLTERGVIPPRTKAESALEVRRARALEAGHG
ncbi:hypothetical protein [Corynebacterium nuruki]|uniref:Uncharacterized protein n=1 Tax=Corynebacterium nuruki TaxID=1032851 RepID=A0A3D4SZ58_9CORY|nr:hypothetical protein [Corynebacterium nuruki]HCT14583.1 hypothetical protein [Corynebacterium nuruki]